MNKVSLFLAMFLFSGIANAEMLNSKHIYSFAKSGDYRSLGRYSRWIDITNSDGDTAVCLAIRNNDVNSYNLLLSYGANSRPSCYASAIKSASGSAKDGTFLGMSGTGWAVTGGVLAAGGIAAAAGGGGGGGSGSSSSQPDQVVCSNHGSLVDGACQCNSGYTGSQCETCDDGYTKYNGSCYKKLACNANQHQEANNCVCDNNYIEQNGTCYPKLSCVNGSQNKNECICDFGYTGFFCNEADENHIIGGDGNLYDKLNCVNGSQVNASCKCTDGWTGATCETAVTCDYDTVECAYGYKETGSTCKSGNTTYKECVFDDVNFIQQGGSIYPKLNCKNGGVQDANTCNCADGWSGATCETAVTCNYDTVECAYGYKETGSTCKSGNTTYKECVFDDVNFIQQGGSIYPKLECKNGGVQNGAACTGCNTGWTGTLCDTSADCGANYKETCASNEYTTGETCPSGGNTLKKCLLHSEMPNCQTLSSTSDTCEICKTGYAGTTCTQAADGYTLFDGVAYQKLACANGSQNKDKCICNSGWGGKLCDAQNTCDYNTTECTEGYVETGKTCTSGDLIYKECKEREVPAGYTTESCRDGYTEKDSILSGTKKYYLCEETDCSAYSLSCREGYDSQASCLSGTTQYYTCTPKEVEQDYTTNECREGYEAYNYKYFGDVKYHQCKAKSVEEGYQETECNTGYVAVDSKYFGDKLYYKCVERVCANYPLLSNPTHCKKVDSCQTTTSTRYMCIECESGYGKNSLGNCVSKSDTIILSEKSKNNSNLSKTNNNYADVYGVYGSNSNDDIYNSYDSTLGNIDITNNSDGKIYGLYSRNKATNSFSKAATTKGNILLKNYGNGDIYGIYAKSGAQNASSESGNSNGLIKINNNGNGKVYGMYTNDTVNTNSGLITKNGFTESGSSIAKIDVTNEGNGLVYGMYAGATGVNSFSETGDVISDISINNTNKDSSTNHNVYGMYGEYILENSVSEGGKATGNITLENTGNNNLYAIYSNGYSHNVSAYANADAKGSINVKNEGNGNVVLITSAAEKKIGINSDLSTDKWGWNKDTYHLYNVRANNATGSSELAIVNKGNGKIIVFDTILSNDYVFSTEDDNLTYNSYAINRGEANTNISIDNTGEGDVVLSSERLNLASAEKFSTANSKISIKNKGEGNIILSNSQNEADKSLHMRVKNNSTINNEISIDNTGSKNIDVIEDTEVEQSSNFTNTTKIKVVDKHGSYSSGSEKGINVDLTTKTKGKGNTVANNVVIDYTGNKDIKVLHNISDSENGSSDNTTITEVTDIKQKGNGNIDVKLTENGETNATISRNVSINSEGTGNISITESLSDYINSKLSNIMNIIKHGRGTVYVKAQNNEATIDNIDGNVTLIGDNGSADITNAGSGTVDVSGTNKTVTVDNTNGTVTISGDSGSADITNNGGTVKVSGDNKTVTANSTDGTLNIDGNYGSAEVIGEGAGNINVSGTSKKVKITSADANINVTGGSGTAEVISTGAGNIEISGDDKTVTVDNAGGSVKVSGNRGSAKITNSGLGDVIISGYNKVVNIIQNGFGDVIGSKNYNSYASSADEQARINITNNNKATVYGVKSENGSAYNVYYHNPYTYSSSSVGTGNISIINKALGNAYGLYGADVYNLTDSNKSSVLEMTNTGNGLAVGLYGTGTIENSGTIKMHNLGDGTAVGIYADSGTVTNSGNITIDRKSYTDDNLTEDTADDTTYSASTEKGGKAIGIYGTKDSNITNSGTITINNMAHAYGIWSEGGTVTNTGTIVIDGDAKTNDSTANGKHIVLNGGTLLQDGRLVAGADLSKVTCAEGYVDFNGICYEKMTCETNRHQEADKCVCDGGYIEQNGVCYVELNCGHGVQNKDSCVCEAGYAGSYCNTCASGYIDQGGICYADLKCQHGYQDKNTCVCETGYAGTTCGTCAYGYVNLNGVCYAKLDCGINQHQEANACVCDSGYINQDGVCYAKLTCGENKHQDKNSCVCDSGYIEQGGVCYVELACGHGYQKENECICDSGYIIREGSKTCIKSVIGSEEGVNNDSINIINRNDDDVYGMYGDFEKTGSKAIDNASEGKTGSISIDNIGNGYIYGMFYNMYAYNASGTNSVGTIDITNNGSGNVYGMYSLGSTDNADGADSTGSIKISNEGDGDVYGMFARGSSYNAVSWKNDSNVSGTIDITNKGNGNVYGMYTSESKAYNARGTGSTGSIKISNEGDGDVYGMLSMNGSQKYNQDNASDGGTGTIDISNNGTGNVYGMYGADLRNSIGEAKGTININNDGTGNVYGMYEKGSYAAVNSYKNFKAESYGSIRISNNNKASINDIYGMYSVAGAYSTAGGNSLISLINQGQGNTYGLYGVSTSNDADDSTQAILEIINAGDGLAVGMYGKKLVDNSGTIKIHNLSNGIAIGMYADADGVTVTNSGNITIDRKSYTDDNLTKDDTSDDTTYSASTEKGGTAIGIYGTKGSTITNSGTITINNMANAYGIWSEGGTVTNTGTIVIDGDAKTNDSTANGKHIVLNGGTLLQDGRLIAGADLSQVTCADGYINLNGICYVDLNCGPNSHQEEDECVCDSGYIDQDGICFAELTCGENQHQNKNFCVCNSGYVEQEGICYTELTCLANQHQDKDSCVCDNGYIMKYESKTCVKSVVGSDAEINDDVINIINRNDDYVYGIYGDESVETIYNAFESERSSITIDNIGLSSVYGMYGFNAYIKNAYCDYSTGIVDITNEKGTSYGLVGDKTYNAYGKNSTGIISINNKGDGGVYGMYGLNGNASYTSAYNAYGEDSVGTIDIINNGTDNFCVYGLFGNNTMNAYGDNSTGNINIANKGNNKGNGYIYGMIGRGGSVYNAGGNNSTGNINITNDSNSFIYGMTGYYITNAGGKNSAGKINITNNGNGDIYGMEGGGLVRNASATNSFGSITINNNGRGTIYGMYSSNRGYNSTGETSNAYNASGENAAGIINITSNNGGRKIYGMYGEDNAINYSNGIIRISNNNKESANTIFGIYSLSLVYNKGTNGKSLVSIINQGHGNTYGLYGKYTSNGNGENVADYDSTRATLEIINTGDGLAVGMYGKESVDNSGTIKIHNLGDGTAVGIYADGGTVANSGNIIIDRESYTDDNLTKDDTSDDTTYSAATEKGGTAIGIYGTKDSNITNTGTITINNATNAYGIWSEGGSVTNTGTITIDGDAKTNDSNADGKHIVLNGGTLLQNGRLVATQTSNTANSSSISTLKSKKINNYVLNLDDMGGKVVATEKAVFEVNGAIAGHLTMSSDIVSKGFKDTYTTNGTIDAEDTSGLCLVSQSALFNASLAENNSDVVMKMKAFDKVVDNKSLAGFLQSNYALENNESFFNTLKKQETKTSLNNALDDLSGKKLFSRFADEDLTMMRELTFDVNNKLFMNNDDHLETSGNISTFNFSSNKGSDNRYALISQNYGNYKLGLNYGFANVRSDDDDNNRRNERMFHIGMPISYGKQGFKFITTPHLGYSSGTYNRKGFNNENYEGNVEKTMFGLVNEARYPFTLGKWTIAPGTEFNVVDYRTQGHEKGGTYKLRLASQNNYSVEAGVGLYANAEHKFSEKSKLTFTNGLTMYHEFADPYKMQVGVYKMSGKFDIRDEKRSDNRAVIRTGLSYVNDNISLSGNVMSYIDKEYRTNAVLDFKYAF